MRKSTLARRSGGGTCGSCRRGCGPARRHSSVHSTSGFSRHCRSRDVRVISDPAAAPQLLLRRMPPVPPVAELWWLWAAFSVATGILSSSGSPKATNIRALAVGAARPHIIKIILKTLASGVAARPRWRRVGTLAAHAGHCSDELHLAAKGVLAILIELAVARDSCRVSQFPAPCPYPPRCTRSQ